MRLANSQLLREVTIYSRRRWALDEWEFGAKFGSLKSEFQELCTRALATESLPRLQKKLNLPEQSPLTGKVKKLEASLQNKRKSSGSQLSEAESIRLSFIAKTLQDLSSRTQQSNQPSKMFRVEGEGWCNFKMFRESYKRLENCYAALARELLEQYVFLAPDLVAQQLFHAANQLQEELAEVQGVNPSAIKRVHEIFAKVATSRHLPYPEFSHLRSKKTL